MQILRSLISRYSIGIFFILAYTLGWSTVAFMNGRILPYGPMLSAILVLAASGDHYGLKDLWKQMTHWRVSWRWYLLAPGIIFAIHLGAFILNLVLGATITGLMDLRPPSGVLLIFPLLIAGGLWEEPGWSGFALPRLQERFASRSSGLVNSSLILGALRAGWHLPLLIYGYIPWYDFLFFVFALQFIITWFYNHTNRSLPVVMLFHLSANVVFAGMLPLFAGVDRTRYFWLFIGLAWFIVLVIRPFTSIESHQQRDSRPTINSAN